MQVFGWFTLSVAALAILASAKTSDSSAKTSGSVLVLPTSGAPMSFDQIEEWHHKLEGIASAVETVKTNVYRDSSGRLRMERTTPEGSSHSSTPSNDVIHIIDPVAGSRVMLVNTGTEKVGYRFFLPKSSGVRFVNYSLAGVGDQGGSSRNSSRTENLGKRIIEGIEFDGIRIVEASEGEPEFTKTVEQWYSADLNLIGLLVVSKPNETYTARIQNVHRNEPAPDLFTVPSDYIVVEAPAMPHNGPGSR